MARWPASGHRCTSRSHEADGPTLDITEIEKSFAKNLEGRGGRGRGRKRRGDADLSSAQQRDRMRDAGQLLDEAGKAGHHDAFESNVALDVAQSLHLVDEILKPCARYLVQARIVRQPTFFWTHSAKGCVGMVIGDEFSSKWLSY